MRVLVVEDSALDRTILRTMVEQLGHTCDEATDGAKAWSRLNQSSYDVILTDWMMPGMTGPELCHRIRRRGDAAYLYTVVCTALDERERGLEAVRAGADLLLTKPIDFVSLEMCLITAARILEMQQELAHRNDELSALNRTLAEHAHTDQLTGLANRRRLYEDLELLAGLAARYDIASCVAMCDVDRFKAYNDRFGHLAGDQVLQDVATILRGSCRDSDTIYRFGGEEMLVLLPHQALDSAVVAVQRLRQAIEATAIRHPDNAPYGVVTISIGVAGLPGGALGDPRALLRHADEALYEAKRSGRNRVVVRRAPVTLG